MIAFFVPGDPVPKQSFRVAGHGRGYTDPRVKAWQNYVSFRATVSTGMTEPYRTELKVSLDFTLGNHRRVDLDNLSKAVLDACNDILWTDDRLICELVLKKHVDPDHPGVVITVEVI